MSIRTFLTYVPSGDVFEHPSGPSLTVPDMTLSLKTLVERYTRSGTLGDVATFTPVFYGEEEVLPIEKMTPQERLDYARAIRMNIRDQRAAMADAASAEAPSAEAPLPVEDESLPASNVVSEDLEGV